VSSEAAAPPRAIVAAADRLRRANEFAVSIRPAYVLGGLLVVQWLALLALALTVRHNGWLYYAGGDQLWHYSGAYLLVHGHLPPSIVGFGWSILLMPLALIAGPNLVSALPGIVLFNTLVLLPVALLCVYGIGARIAGRLFGYFAAGLWIALPYLGILFVEPGYHQKYTELTLPQLLGLTSVPDFPAMVALLVSAYLCLRALDKTSWYVAGGAGLAAGYSIAIKPSNSIFLVAPALLLLVTRWRAVLWFAVGLAPALVTLVLWKYRGLGELAAAPAEQVRVAAGVDSLLHRIHNPELNSWQHLHNVFLGLREHFWVARVMEWLPVAGAIGLLARSRRAFLLIASWFAVFLLVKGTYVQASVEDASFWRIMMPSYPAYLILAASIVLLVPGLRARPAMESLALSGRRRTAVIAGAAAVFVVLPLGVIAATSPLHDQGRQAVRVGDSLVPVSAAVGLKASAVDGDVRLSWQDRSASTASAFYRVLRSNRPGATACAGRLRNAADDCRLYMDLVPRATRSTSYVDRPGAGNWTYRIGVAANWLDDPTLGDIYVVSPPASVRVK
jgi:hypothetical protein